MKRRAFICMAVAATAALSTASAATTSMPMTIYKDPNCGCCHVWAEAMRNAGFAVTVKNTDDLEPVKARLLVPEEVRGCHTAVIRDYFLEGHVPLEAVQRLLTRTPAIAGLAVPGMPEGSLGMGDSTNARYEVFAVSRTGETELYYQVGKEN